jgi:hypothetical protein
MIEVSSNIIDAEFVDEDEAKDLVRVIEIPIKINTLKNEQVINFYKKNSSIGKMINFYA